MTTVKIWVDENQEAPTGFQFTEEKFWAGASWGWAHIGEVNDSQIHQVGYGECIYFREIDYPIERLAVVTVR